MTSECTYDGDSICVHLYVLEGHHSTGKERDAESGNDYFGARYYASTMGRFLSPDQPFVDQHPDNPQSWNLYAYARNNPLILIDPTGLGCLNDLGRADATHEKVSIDNSISSDDCRVPHPRGASVFAARVGSPGACR